ncbi:aminoglycoside phosphotransferase family protein [Marinomonas sp. 2405UD68-3]|uniref:aminoglycoside phosphotransferase family protein n=1 Tax=Marinomonas sp. 2405UD68-3 TaxID=3391835 RepID=UPI0039C985F7
MINVGVTSWLSTVLGTSNFNVKALTGGANNRGYQVTNGHKNWFLKSFSPLDTHSEIKLLNEFSFSEHLWKNDIKSIPQPIAYSGDNLVSLYSFIKGNAIKSADHNKVMSAIKFISDINQFPSSAYKLNIASESPNSLYEFANIVERRLQRFHHAEPQGKLTKLLENISIRTATLKQQLPISWRVEFERNILSPSDFGFHNALEMNDKQLIFFDFEYAGLDTPWKLISDFFSQPAIPVNLKYLKEFISRPNFSTIADEKDVFKIVFELTQLKWCLIMLNEFLPDIQKRRLFSWNDNRFSSSMLADVQQQQLSKSQHYFDAIAVRTELISEVI